MNILNKVKVYCEHKSKENQLIDPKMLSELITQWEFDKEIESTYSMSEQLKRKQHGLLMDFYNKE